MYNEIKQIQDFYLRCALRCYVTGEVPKHVDPETNERSYEVIEGIFRYRDRYIAVNECSFGETVISSTRTKPMQPLWVMQYNGWCRSDDRRIHDFLKTALAESYNNGNWNFGRGPFKFTDERWPELQYVIDGTDSNNFMSFHALELIRDLNNRSNPSVFQHRIQGQLLSLPKD